MRRLYSYRRKQAAAFSSKVVTPGPSIFIITHLRKVESRYKEVVATLRSYIAMRCRAPPTLLPAVQATRIKLKLRGRIAWLIARFLAMAASDINSLKLEILSEFNVKTPTMLCLSVILILHRQGGVKKT